MFQCFYATAVFNFITWNAAYSIFPRSTFIHHETFPTKGMNEYFGGLHAKYKKRGWRMKIPSELPPRGANGPNILHGLADLVGIGIAEDRTAYMRVGRRTTWKMPLDMNAIPVSAQA